MTLVKTAAIAILLAVTLSSGSTNAIPSSMGYCELIKSTFRNHIETIFLIETAHFRLKDKYGVDGKIYDEALSHYNSRLSFKAANELSNHCPIG
jgi:hypothetical protein